ncbi:MAG: tRNA (adenosine(37)-N6)-threonylcarbamoyltransferase complex dimerization subunit type 1 TsaB [Spirochaetia bacterium]
MNVDGRQMTVLSLDTATEVLSLSAVSGDSWAALSVHRGLQHSPALLPLAERLLQDLGTTVKDLELIVCSIGPGSFTGIRIGLATALGIGHGRGIPVVGVSTLDALASSWAAYGGDVFPVIDARRGNIYTARYRGGSRLGEYRDVSPADLAGLLAQAQSPLLVGADSPRILELLGDAQGVARGEFRAARGGLYDAVSADSVDPRSLLRLGVESYCTRGADPAPPRPLYLRKSEAERVSGR